MATRFRAFSAADWRKNLRQLKKFIAEHGHSNVRSSWESNPELAGWVVNLREHIHKISGKQLAQLLEIGFFSEREKRWFDHYHKLAIFKEVMGHCRVPARWSKNPTLARWVDNQRSHPDKILPYQKKLLDSLGFVWRQRRIQRLAWEDRYAELVEYYNAYGDCNVPAKWEENPALGAWVSAHRLGQVEVTAKKRGLLNSLGFDWDPLGSAWEAHFKNLKAYKKAHGDCRVPDGSEEYPGLAIWVANTRRRRTSLTPQQERKLERIGFDWNPHESFWEEHFEKLKKFKKKYGHCNVPARWEKDKRLAHWVHEQRQRMRKKRIAPEKRKLLESLGFVESIFDARWEQRFAELEDFKKRFGHCFVPVKNWPENPALDNWCCHQRYHWKELSLSRRRRLKALGFEPKLNERGRRK